MISKIDETRIRKPLIMAITEAGGIGPKMFQQLLLRFGPPENLLDISRADLQEVQQLNDEKIDRLLESLEKLHLYEEKIDSYQEDDVHVCTLLDDSYPELLRTIGDPPPLFYYRGNISLLRNEYLAIVGTTKATQEGIRLAVDLAKESVSRGFGIVSGLAAGIDSAAHLGAVKADGTTIAVLGSGVLEIYPQENQPLAELILQNGMLISEYPPYRNVTKPSLVLRNRIISALSKAVVVAQIGKDTRGELRTAAYAYKQTKPIFYGDPAGDLDYERVREWPGTIFETVESIEEIIKYIV